MVHGHFHGFEWPQTMFTTEAFQVRGHCIGSTPLRQDHSPRLLSAQQGWSCCKPLCICAPAGQVSGLHFFGQGWHLHRPQSAADHVAKHRTAAILPTPSAHETARYRAGNDHVKSKQGLDHHVQHLESAKLIVHSPTQSRLHPVEAQFTNLFNNGVKNAPVRFF